MSWWQKQIIKCLRSEESSTSLIKTTVLTFLVKKRTMKHFGVSIFFTILEKKLQIKSRTRIRSHPRI